MSVVTSFYQTLVASSNTQLKCKPLQIKLVCSGGISPESTQTDVESVFWVNAFILQSVGDLLCCLVDSSTHPQLGNIYHNLSSNQHQYLQKLQQSSTSDISLDSLDSSVFELCSPNADYISYLYDPLFHLGVPTNVLSQTGLLWIHKASPFIAPYNISSSASTSIATPDSTSPSSSLLATSVLSSITTSYALTRQHTAADTLLWWNCEGCSQLNGPSLDQLREIKIIVDNITSVIQTITNDKQLTHVTTLYIIKHLDLSIDITDVNFYRDSDAVMSRLVEEGSHLNTLINTLQHSTTTQLPPLPSKSWITPLSALVRHRLLSLMTPSCVCCSSNRAQPWLCRLCTCINPYKQPVCINKDDKSASLLPGCRVIGGDEKVFLHPRVCRVCRCSGSISGDADTCSNTFCITATDRRTRDIGLNTWIGTSSAYLPVPIRDEDPLQPVALAILARLVNNKNSYTSPLLALPGTEKVGSAQKLNEYMESLPPPLLQVWKRIRRAKFNIMRHAGYVSEDVPFFEEKGLWKDDAALALVFSHSATKFDLVTVLYNVLKLIAGDDKVSSLRSSLTNIYQHNNQLFSLIQLLPTSIATHVVDILAPRNGFLRTMISTTSTVTTTGSLKTPILATSLGLQRAHPSTHLTCRPVWEWRDEEKAILVNSLGEKMNEADEVESALLMARFNQINIKPNANFMSQTMKELPMILLSHSRHDEPLPNIITRRWLHLHTFLRCIMIDHMYSIASTSLIIDVSTPTILRLYLSRVISSELQQLRRCLQSSLQSQVSSLHHLLYTNTQATTLALQEYTRRSAHTHQEHDARALRECVGLVDNWLNTRTTQNNSSNNDTNIISTIEMLSLVSVVHRLGGVYVDTLLGVVSLRGFVIQPVLNLSQLSSLFPVLICLPEGIATQSNYQQLGLSCLHAYNNTTIANADDDTALHIATALLSLLQTHVPSAKLIVTPHVSRDGDVNHTPQVLMSCGAALHAEMTESNRQSINEDLRALFAREIPLGISKQHIMLIALELGIGRWVIDNLTVPSHSSLPSCWRYCSYTGPHAEMHILPSWSVDHAFVMSRFHASCPRDQFTIVSIRYIVHPSMWRLHESVVQSLADRARSSTSDTDHNEVNNDVKSSVDLRWGWHGTHRGYLPSIINKGFRREVTVQAMYGKGVYFAESARYSANLDYSQLDASNVPIPTEDDVEHWENKEMYQQMRQEATSNQQHMFLCRFATGNKVLGRKDILIPPPDCDTLVDNLANPSILVMQHDHQSFPLYLVTFTSQRK